MARTKRTHLTLPFYARKILGGYEAEFDDPACGIVAPERTVIEPNWVTCKACRAWWDRLSPFKKRQATLKVEKYRALMPLSDFLKTVPRSELKLTKDDIDEIVKRIVRS